MEDTDKKMKFVELRARGLSFVKISKELEICKQTCINWSKEFELLIANLKEMEIEALLEECSATKFNRIQSFGECLTKVKLELDRRNLSDVSTDKLLEHYTKLSEILKKESSKVVFKRKEDILSLDIAGTEEWEG